MHLQVAVSVAVRRLAAGSSCSVICLFALICSRCLHTLLTRGAKYDRLQLRGDFHLFCSDSPPPVMTCKWCAPTISCYSWMDFGDALSCLPAAGNKGRDNLRSCSTLSEFGSDSVYFLFLFYPSFPHCLSSPLPFKSCVATQPDRYRPLQFARTHNQISASFDSYWTAVTHEITCPMSEPTSSTECRTSIWLNT